VANLDPGSIGLKWPNDLVLGLDRGDAIGKLGGVLGESEGLGTADVRAVVGIGVNVDWSGHAVPDDIASTMTTLRRAGGRPIDIGGLGDAFLDRLADALARLRDGDFARRAWADRQVTTGRAIALELPDGERRTVVGIGVDEELGALLVEPEEAGAPPRSIHAADVVHVRLSEPRV
jgi:biotin-(acetyl-CoA carboxylase) ligase